MPRAPLLAAFALAALVLALAPPAAAQSLGCVERPVGAPMDITVLVPVPGLPGARAAVTPAAPAQPRPGLRRRLPAPARHPAR